jgi:hypothetical protein
MGPTIFSGSNRFSGLRPTPVYDSYWRFAAERQAIFFRRLAGNTSSWTNDPILRRYKFTNAYRASDRVSQYLIRHVQYNDLYSSAPDELLFRTLLFKFFNKIETWQLLESRLGPLTWEGFNSARYDAVLSEAMNRGHRVYSAAYIVPPVQYEGSDGIKHRGHLWLLEQVMADHLQKRLLGAPSLSAVFQTLKSLPSLGNFLAFQLAIDLNYSSAIDHDEMEFVVAGPGARDGISKCFENAAEFSPEDIIEFVCDRQNVEFERLGIHFQDLWGRRLQLIDCQNLFCEISKYARVAHPEVEGISGRIRIKQRFEPKSAPLMVWYPPKWGLNDKLHEQPWVACDLLDYGKSTA